MAPYRPGKSAAQAEAEHGIADAIKLASNENPFPPVTAVTAAIAAAASGVNRYADHRAAELRAALASWVGVEPDQVTVGCGSVGLLQQLCITYLDPGDEAVFPWLSFEAYPVMVAQMAATSVRVPLVDHTFDLDAVAAAVTDRTKLVLLATPNNPTGTAVSTAALAAMIERVPSDVIVLVDEAYREFVDPGFGDPVADLVPRFPNVVVSRTLSKAYGLAGLRLGYAVGAPEVITELDKVLLAFAVNGLAQAAGLAALGALDEIRPNIDTLLTERTRLVGELVQAGWRLPDAQANFVYLPIGAATAGVAVELERRGVVVRPFANEGIRVTVGTVEQNDRFLAAFGEVIAPLGEPSRFPTET